MMTDIERLQRAAEIERALEAYARELGVATLPVEDLIRSHRRVVTELNTTTRPAYAKEMKVAVREVARVMAKKGYYSLKQLRRMSLAKLVELLNNET